MSSATPLKLLGDGSRFDSPHKEATRLLDHFRMMVRIRTFEIAAEENAALGHIRGMIHSAVGQEAVAVGVCANLLQTDAITTTHRNHHHALAKGVEPAGVMAELFGRRTGVCKGKGGSMHIADFGRGMLGANGVVAASLSIAVGVSKAFSLRGSDAISVAFFGDGGINRGQCLEALNFAAVFRHPVLFVCEDNAWSATTRTSDVSAGPGIVSRALALGLDALSVNGNDVIAVDRSARNLVLEIRCGLGPRLLHCRTYRLRGHTCTDQASYRSQCEVENGYANDPLLLCRAELQSLGVANQKLAKIQEDEALLIRKAVEVALSAPHPSAEDAFNDIQCAGAVQ